MVEDAVNDDNSVVALSLAKVSQLLSDENTRSHAHVYNNDVLDRCACGIKLILLSVVFVLVEMDKMIELECHVMGKWINNVR